MVYVAGISETTAAIGLGAGVLSPLSSSIAIGTMLVASYAMSSKGVWNVNGGCELAVTYAVIAAALGFVGPGRFSVDHAVGWDENAGNGWGSAALGAAVFAAGVACLRARSITRRRTNTDVAR
jgi:putative oxidoreductase